MASIVLGISTVGTITIVSAGHLSGIVVMGWLIIDVAGHLNDVVSAGHLDGWIDPLLVRGISMES